jgi:hypothetical protein
LEEQALLLPLLLKNQLPNRLLNLLRSLLPNPSNNQNQLRKKRWIWVDCLIENINYLNKFI